MLLQVEALEEVLGLYMGGEAGDNCLLNIQLLQNQTQAQELVQELQLDKLLDWELDMVLDRELDRVLDRVLDRQLKSIEAE